MPSRRRFDVSVVIPLFNKAEYARAAVESAIEQSHAAWEIIVVDDGSTDGSAERIRDLADERVRIVEQSNAGPGPARNRGVAEARADWVAFLDADDLWLEDHLATLADVATAFPQAALVGSNFSDGAPIARARSKPYVADLFAGPPAFFHTSSVAVRRSVFQRTGGFGNFWPGEDVELWARLALDHDIALSPRTTILYRQHTGGLMEQSQGRFGNKMEMQPIFATLEAALSDKKQAPRHDSIAAYRDRWLAIFAQQALAAGRPKVASAYLARMRPGSRQGGMFIRVLAKLPAPILRAGMRIRSPLRRSQ